MDQVLANQYGQTQAINKHTREIVATALLEIHASFTRDLQKQTELLSSIISGKTLDVRIKAAMKADINIDRDIPSQKVSSGEWARKDVEVFDKIQKEEAKTYKSISQAVVSSLHFETITERYEGIAEAHRQTFDWIFEPMIDHEDPGEDAWSDYVQWLRKGNGLYWIHGKAGSGKSTLMKYIYENAKTSEHVKVWADGSPIHIAPFFFFSGGTKLQKSQDGLLRTLLFDVLRWMPELVPYVLPTDYARRYNTTNRIQYSGRNPDVSVRNFFPIVRH